MDSLEELKKKIYKPGASFEDRLKRPDLATPQEQDQGSQWQSPQKSPFKVPSKTKKILAGVFFGVFFVVLSFTAFFIWQANNSFDKNKVDLEINGPDNLESGAEAIYRIDLRNKTKSTLSQIKLTVIYPEGSILEGDESLIQRKDLSDLGPNEFIKTEVPVRITGLKDDLKEIRVSVEYVPSDFNSRFINESEYTTKIISVPFSLGLDIPSELVSGQDFSFSLEYLNQSDLAFENMILKIDYPQGFVYDSAEPQPSQGDNVWQLDNLMAGEQDKISIKGSLQGEAGYSKSFRAVLGSYEDNRFVPFVETDKSVLMSISPLYIYHKAQNDIVSAGDSLRYTIYYKNTTEFGINAVFIAVELNERTRNLIDMSVLRRQDVFFDDNINSIVWRASNKKELEYLAPGQEGNFSFNLKIKKDLPIFSYEDKNPSVITVAKIGSDRSPAPLQDIQITGEDKVEVKIKSQFDLVTRGFYNDDLISNSGPIPPRIGQPTTYTIRWELFNDANDLSEVKVEAYLPQQARFNDLIYPADVNLKYYPDTGRLIWNVGNLSAGTGTYLPAKIAAFQVVLTPSSIDLGKSLTLIGDSSAVGIDTYVDLELNSSHRSIDTRLPDDPSIGNQESKVVN